MAGGAGYKCVSLTPFKRYASEDSRNKLNGEPVRVLQRMLHDSNSQTAKSAAMELMRRHKNGRQMPLTVGDFERIADLTGYGKKEKSIPNRNRRF
jgi:hypothetical protein